METFPGTFCLTPGNSNKDPSPESPALGYPWKGIVCSQAFAGVLEYWRIEDPVFSGIGVLKKQRTKTFGTCYDLGKMLFFLTYC